MAPGCPHGPVHGQTHRLINLTGAISTSCAGPSSSSSPLLPHLPILHHIRSCLPFKKKKKENRLSLFWPHSLDSVQLTLSLAFVSHLLSLASSILLPCNSIDNCRSPVRSETARFSNRRLITIFNNDHDEDLHHSLGPCGPLCRVGHSHEDREAAAQQARIAPHRHRLWQR